MRMGWSRTFEVYVLTFNFWIHTIFQKMYLVHANLQSKFSWHVRYIGQNAKRKRGVELWKNREIPKMGMRQKKNQGFLSSKRSHGKLIFCGKHLRAEWTGG